MVLSFLKYPLGCVLFPAHIVPPGWSSRITLRAEKSLLIQPFWGPSWMFPFISFHVPLLMPGEESQSSPSDSSYSGWNLSLFNFLLHVLILRNQTSEILLQTYQQLRSPANNLLYAWMQEEKMENISKYYPATNVFLLWGSSVPGSRPYYLIFTTWLEGRWECEIQLPSCF